MAHEATLTIYVQNIGGGRFVGRGVITAIDGARRRICTDISTGRDTPAAARRDVVNWAMAYADDVDIVRDGVGL